MNALRSLTSGLLAVSLILAISASVSASPLPPAPSDQSEISTQKLRELKGLIIQARVDANRTFWSKCLEMVTQPVCSNTENESPDQKDFPQFVLLHNESQGEVHENMYNVCVEFRDRFSRYDMEQGWLMNLSLGLNSVIEKLVELKPNVPTMKTSTEPVRTSEGSRAIMAVLRIVARLKTELNNMLPYFDKQIV